MNHSDYQRALEKLPLLEPEAGTVKRVLPHLHEEYIEERLDFARLEGQEVYFAAPPLLVNGRFHVLQYHNGNLLKGIEPRLRWYAASGKRMPINAYPALSTEEIQGAITYARKNWTLIKDTWQDFALYDHEGTTYFFTTNKAGDIAHITTNPHAARELGVGRTLKHIPVPLEKILKAIQHHN